MKQNTLAWVAVVALGLAPQLARGDDATDMAIIIARVKAGIKTPLPPCDSQSSSVSQAASAWQPYAPEAPAVYKPTLILFTDPASCPPCYTVDHTCLTDARVQKELKRFTFTTLPGYRAAEYGCHLEPTLYVNGPAGSFKYGDRAEGPLPTDPAAFAIMLRWIADAQQEKP